MASIERRVGALEEEYINQLVDERLQREVEALLDVLEKHLSRAEFARVARIVVKEGGHEA